MKVKVKGVKETISKLDAWVDQAEGVAVATYRKAIWEVFLEILEETPQMSGRAVANWRLGVGSPDTYHDDTLGDAPEMTTYKSGQGMYLKQAYHRKGDRKWIQHAIDENIMKAGVKRKYGIPSNAIKLGDRVFISNNVQGDNDNGKTSSENYLTELQDPGYWVDKLRAVNQPYVTVAAVLLKFSWQAYAMAGSTHLEDFMENAWWRAKGRGAK